MKKLLLKISLLNFILTTPTLVLLNNYNQSLFENYMHQQEKNSRKSKITPSCTKKGDYLFQWNKDEAFLYVIKKMKQNVQKLMV